MTNAEIKKVLNMIEEMRFDKATTFLKQQLLKNDCKENYNLTNLVKKIIFNKDLEKTRPSLASIQITNGGTQSICNGYVGIKWKKYEKCLDTFPQNTINPLNLDNIFNNYKEYELKENDKIILKNLKKVKDYLKNNITEKDNKKLLLYLFGKILDLNVIEETLKIALYYNEELKFYTDEEILSSAINIENSHIKAVILPVKSSEKEMTRIIERTQMICDILGEN